MKNNKSAMLALLMLAGSAFVMAAEPHHDAHAAHDKPVADAANAQAKTETAVPAAALKPNEMAPANATMTKPAFKKKKSRMSKAPMLHKKAGHAASTHKSPAQTAVSHTDAHSHAQPAQPAQPALPASQFVVADKPARPRNRVATLADSHPAVVANTTHADVPAAAHAEAKTTTVPDAKPEMHVEAASEPVKKIPEVETLAAVEIQNSAPVMESATSCNTPSKTEIAALFDRWNATLKTGDAKKVVANYATPSVLLPTVSNQARFTAAEKEDYFVHFLQRKPEGKIDDRIIEVDCNSATDAGLYSFKFVDGSVVKARYSFFYKRVDDTWLISSHHSSAMPEKAATASTQDNHASPVIALERNEAAPRNLGWIRFP